MISSSKFSFAIILMLLLLMGPYIQSSDGFAKFPVRSTDMAKYQTNSSPNFIPESNHIQPKWIKILTIFASASVCNVFEPTSLLLHISDSSNFAFAATSDGEDDVNVDLSKDDNELLNLRLEKRNRFKKKLTMEKLKAMPDVTFSIKDLKDSQDRVISLKAYLDEAERYLRAKQWDKLLVYLNVFAEQENAFANLIDNQFPGDDALDKTARTEMTFEAQWMFLALDDLREASKDHQYKAARSLYAKLLLAYDRFLKAGNLYPSYDFITSTEVLFKQTPRDTLRFDTTSKLIPQDKVVLTSGPDMGKSGTIIDIDTQLKRAIVKFDRDDNNYQEVKDIKLELLAKQR